MFDNFLIPYRCEGINPQIPLSLLQSIRQVDPCAFTPSTSNPFLIQISYYFPAFNLFYDLYRFQSDQLFEFHIEIFKPIAGKSEIFTCTRASSGMFGLFQEPKLNSSLGSQHP